MFGQKDNFADIFIMVYLSKMSFPEVFLVIKRKRVFNLQLLPIGVPFLLHH